MGFAFEELLLYKRAVAFAVSVIDAVEEIQTPGKHYRLLGQLEASSSSVALNIAEGKGRHSKKEFKQFLYIARGSPFETIATLDILHKKGWLSTQVYKALYGEAEEINKRLSGLINSISKES